ncbi:hypothetical protein C2E23DRAFT_461620 [Lenzites betulinus]|nr:hypothetical protein C2E23DRAFT_461620 [Lenzites betulinus]
MPTLSSSTVQATSTSISASSSTSTGGTLSSSSSVSTSPSSSSSSTTPRFTSTLPSLSSSRAPNQAGNSTSAPTSSRSSFAPVSTSSKGASQSVSSPSPGSAASTLPAVTSDQHTTTIIAAISSVCGLLFLICLVLGARWLYKRRRRVKGNFARDDLSRLAPLSPLITEDTTSTIPRSIIDISKSTTAESPRTELSSEALSSTGADISTLLSVTTPFSQSPLTSQHIPGEELKQLHEGTPIGRVSSLAQNPARPTQESSASRVYWGHGNEEEPPPYAPRE